MSITNIICNGEITLVQGVNGLFLCEESWVTQSRKASLGRADFLLCVTHDSSQRKSPFTPCTSVISPLQMMLVILIY